MMRRERRIRWKKGDDEERKKNKVREERKGKKGCPRRDNLMDHPSLFSHSRPFSKTRKKSNKKKKLKFEEVWEREGLSIRRKGRGLVLREGYPKKKKKWGAFEAMASKGSLKGRVRVKLEEKASKGSLKRRQDMVCESSCRELVSSLGFFMLREDGNGPSKEKTGFLLSPHFPLSTFPSLHIFSPLSIPLPSSPSQFLCPPSLSPIHLSFSSLSLSLQSISVCSLVHTHSYILLKFIIPCVVTIHKGRKPLKQFQDEVVFSRCNHSSQWIRRDTSGFCKIMWAYQDRFVSWSGIQHDRDAELHRTRVATGCRVTVPDICSLDPVWVFKSAQVLPLFSLCADVQRKSTR